MAAGTGGAAAGPGQVLAGRFSSWQLAFIRGLSASTGLDMYTVAAWVLAEGGPPDNPLNIGPGQHYSNPVAATTSFLRQNSYYRGILASAKHDNPVAQVMAIARSPWDGGTVAWGNPAGHYGGKGQHLLADLKSIDPHLQGSGGSLIGDVTSLPGKAAGAVTGAVSGVASGVAHTVLDGVLRLVFIGFGLALIGFGVMQLFGVRASDVAKTATTAAVAA